MTENKVAEFNNELESFLETMGKNIILSVKNLILLIMIRE